MKPKFFYKNFFLVIGIDLLLISGSVFLAYLVRFDFYIPKDQMANLLKIYPFLVIIKIGTFFVFNLYRGMWRYTGIIDLFNIIKSISISSTIVIIGILMYYRFEGYPRSVFIIDAVFSLVFISGFRLTIRLVLTNVQMRSYAIDVSNRKKKLLIIGAGDAGEKVVREINDNPRIGYQIIGFLDDDRGKIGRTIHGIRIIGKIDEINPIANENGVEEILIAIPSANGDQMRRIVEQCGLTNISYKTLPGIGELIDGKVSIKKVRDISYKDLLGRQSVYLENERISEYLKKKCIMITGSGGSIGSEICRQICKFYPSLIVLYDSSESNLYSIQMELKHVFKNINYVAVLGKVQDQQLIERVVKKYQPNIIFHAAAYKHVPLIERNPWEAIYSNIVGTKIVADTALINSVERFVLVSTDKAVRPTNVMGASKRVAEIIIQSMPIKSTKFMAVRFGNVIGSSGSVIPLFYKQIENGGPVTVTHPEITRYFMTIEEAAQLVLQAFTMGKGREIFILEMGKPVKIVDVAKDLIRLSGKTLGSEIDIEFTGLRPGEKLYEELIAEDEGVLETDHNKIFALKNGDSSVYDYRLLMKQILDLKKVANEHDADKIKCKLKEIVKDYVLTNNECVL